MTFEIKEGASNADIRRHIRELDRKIAKGIRVGFDRVGRLLTTTAREQMMEKPKHGRLYRIKRGSQTRNHTASAPYESPANVSGALRKSIGFEQAGMVLAFGAGGRSSGVNYAEYVNDGTRNMYPRYLLPNAVKKQDGAIMPMMQEAVGHEINLIQGT